MPVVVTEPLLYCTVIEAPPDADLIPRKKRKLNGARIRIKQEIIFGRTTRVVPQPGDEEKLLHEEDVLSIISDEKVSSSGGISGQLNYEKYIRTLDDDFAQCHCGLRKGYLAPVGQQLQFITGFSMTGKAPNTTSQRHTTTQHLPLELLDRRQVEKYQKIEGVCCWWCRHPFEGNPVGCPISHCKVWNVATQKKRDEYKLHGYFCSYPCAKAYGLGMELHNPRLKLELGSYFQGLLLVIVKKMRERGELAADYRVPILRAAPHFSVLKTFGGSMSIEDFRKSTELDNGHQLTIVPDWVQIIPSGMLAFDHPKLEKGFDLVYNIHMAGQYANIRSRPQLQQSMKRKMELQRRETKLLVRDATRKTHRRGGRVGRFTIRRPPRMTYKDPQRNQIQMCMAMK